MNKEQVAALLPHDKLHYHWWDNWKNDPKQDAFGEVVSVSDSQIVIQWEKRSYGGEREVVYDLSDETAYSAFWAVVELLPRKEETA